MRLNKLWYVLAGTFIFITGCSDNDLEKEFTPIQEGDVIIFGARAGFEQDANAPETKTIYTGKKFTEGTKEFERVDWVSGDEISIICPQARATGSTPWANYTVTPTDPDKTAGNSDIKEDYGSLAPTSDGALQWGDTATQHNFYAVYPSPKQNPTVSLENRNGKIMVKGRVPLNQIPYKLDKTTQQSPNKTLYIARPVMRNAYMTAVKKIKNPNNFIKNNKTINLSFRSIVTALEMEFTAPTGGVTLLSAMVSSKKHNLSGNFECELTNLNNKEYPKCTSTEGEAANQVIIPLSQDVNGVKKGLELKEGEMVRITAFILPIENLDDLQLTITGTKGLVSGQRSHALQGPDGPLKAHLKHYVKNVTLPNTFNSSNWLSFIHDDVLLSQLSIPGTGDSYTGDITVDIDEKTQRTQTLPVQEQWNMGIRAFTLTSDRSDNATIESEHLIAAKKAMGKTVTQGVDAIYNLIQNTQSAGKPTEFAIVIMRYQPWKERNCNDYLSDFTNFFDSWSIGKNVKLFRPDMTVGEARGSILFMACPSSEGEDVLKTTVAQNKNFVTIEGWGSLQDNWAKRGYKNPDGQQVANSAIKNKSIVENSVEYHYMVNKKTPLKPTIPGAADMNYVYNTNQQFRAWVQDWPRVARTDMNVTVGTDNIFWWESYNEKLTHAKATFERAVKNKTNTTDIYINSLCGYYIIDNEQKSYSPDYNPSAWSGAYGDIPAFSTAINNDFYNYMWSVWNSQKPEEKGPMGIILINRVGADEPSVLMTNVVISNNFVFSLIKQGGATPNPPVKVDNAYQNGGDIIK